MAAAAGAAAAAVGRRTVLITGGSSGVGASLARMLAPRCDLFLVGRNEAALARVRDETRALGARTEVAAADVSVEADVDRAMAACRAMCGGVPPDAAVLNAGVNRVGRIEETTPADFDTVVGTNLRGVYLFLRAVIPGMRERGSGQIVVTSSVLGERAAPRASLYCASKFAVEGMVGSVREELAGSGVRIGSVLPGMIATAWWDEFERGGRRLPSPDKARMLAPEAVADAIRVLLDQHPTSDIRALRLDPSAVEPPRTG